jgi:hypothetical protein
LKGSASVFSCFGLAALSFFGLVLPCWPAQVFSPERACFQARCNQQPLAYTTQCLFVLPGQTVCVEVLEKCRPDEYTLESPECGFKPVKAACWQGSAPAAPGLYPAQLKRVADQKTLRVQIFVMVPFARLCQGKFNGYHIGTYPVPSGRLAGYGLPQGFIEVTAANCQAAVSPHFQLKQFVCKQTGGYPQYIVLRPELVNKLEKVLEQLNAAGHPRTTLRLLSAYRTPYYNHLIHDVRFSAHQWGLAADVVLEADAPGPDDDLNHDGRVDVQDAEILFHIVDAWDAQPGNASQVGGLGLYPRTTEHGPFVHIDARGYCARWAEAPARLPGSSTPHPVHPVRSTGAEPQAHSTRNASSKI